jgi:hypothetical protein
MKLSLLDRFLEKVHISNFMKVSPLGAELFHADRRTDMTKLIADFCYFVNVPKNLLLVSGVLYLPLGIVVNLTFLV